MRDIHFGSVAELVEATHNAEFGEARFAVQFVLVSGLNAWRELLSSLRAECTDFALSALCVEDDLLPDLTQIREMLEQAQGRRVLLLPLGEMLHLAPSLTPVAALATWTSPSKKRVIVPVLERRDLITAALEKVDRYRNEECEVWSLDGAGEVHIHALPFAVQAHGCKTAQGVRQYFELWERGGASSIQLVSYWATSWSQAELLGRLTFHVSPDGFSALSSLVGAVAGIDQSTGTDEEWRWLASEVHPGENFGHLAGRLLNLVQADSKTLLETWPLKTPRMRWLSWLWARSMPATGTFADLVVRESASSHSLAENVGIIVYQKDLAIEQLAERRRLLQLLGDDELPSSFWHLFDEQSDPLLRLKALPGLTVRQREQIILEAAKLVQAGINEDAWLPVLAVTYPSLATYLTAFPIGDSFVRDYLLAYVRSRLTDAPLVELGSCATKWADDKTVWEHATRASLIGQNTGLGTLRFWVDALGIEWAGLLHALLNDDETECIARCGRAELPTSTFYNREWSNGEPVERELDNLAHALGYTYPRSLVSEIDLVEELAKRIRSQLERCSQVVVSSDHGLTRFAACGEPISPPDGFKVHKWGRFASASKSASELPSSDAWLCHNQCLILAHHGLFKGGARNNGEVHGGATIEEALVPVLVVRKRQRARPVAALVHSSVLADNEGVVWLAISLDAAVGELRLVVGGRILDAKRAVGNDWRVAIPGLRAGRYQGLLQYEGGTLGEMEFEVLQHGLTKDDMGLDR